MTSTYTTDLRLTKQGTGDNSGTWGVVANNVFQLIEDSIAGLVNINVNTTTGDYTLSTANGATDEARNMILKLSGSPAAAKNVIIPAVSKLYLVECTIGTAVTITIKTNSGSGFNMLTGQKSFVYCDGLNVFSAEADLTALGVTATAGELNILDGAVLTTTELNILHGVTATTAEINVLDGITATVAELNILDGATVTVAELNVLDGITATTAELNYVHGVASPIQTQLNALTASVSAVPIVTNSTSGKIVMGAVTLQWGISTANTGGSSVIFPTSYSSDPYGVFLSAVFASGLVDSQHCVQSVSSTGFVFFGINPTYWFAIGPT